jgi:hypothetical protein
MRVKDVDESHRQLLRELSRRVSKRLVAEFANLPGTDGPNIGIELQENGQKVLVELPATLLLKANGDVSSREALRIRIKSGRDRMLFRHEPISLEKRGSAGARAAYAGFGSGGGQGRGRR